MAKPTKSEIKKMIADLHAKSNGGAAEKEHHGKESVHVKNAGGPKRAGIYRPKV